MINLNLHFYNLGGVGWAATQLAKTVENVTVYGAASKHKHADIIKNGVDHAIDHTNNDYISQLQELSTQGSLSNRGTYYWFFLNCEAI